MVEFDRLAQAGQQLLGESLQLLWPFKEGISTRNSSPPSRAATSLWRRTRRIRSASSEQFIAGAMAQGVIDQLETVQIDEQQGQLLLVELGGLEFQLQPLLQQVAVAELGQGS